jgi:iron complex transport system ATP-binding protein
VNRGEVLSILGGNGCGKTTLLCCLNGLLPLQEGEVRLNGKDITHLGVTRRARKISFVFQEHSAPFPFTVTEVVRMGRAPFLGFFSTPSARDEKLVADILELVGIAHLRHKPYTQISGGERQLVLIARAIAQQPEVILLDEPTSHLDFKNQALVLKLVNRLSRQGMTVIMTTHLPNHALLFSSKVALMAGGKIHRFGPPDQVMDEPGLRETYGIDVRIFTGTCATDGRTIKYCVPDH